jgi:hypothetical protein
MSQVCAFASPFSASVSAIGMLRQSSGNSSFASLLHSRERVLGERDKPYEATVMRPDELRRFDLSLCRDKATVNQDCAAVFVI